MTMLAISADAQAIALACSTLALTGDTSLKPMTPTEWHGLSVAMRSSELRPRDLIGLNADELRDALGLAAAMAERLAGLLSRGGQLAFETERLASIGIWIVTRADDAYPPALKQRLRGHAPPLLFGAGPQGGLQLPAIAIIGSRDVDDQGLAFASSLALRCVEQGFAVVSGAARGVDLAAMAAALSHGGAAIGVTVDPLERLIRRRELRLAIGDDLLTLATPFHPSARWHAGNAMRRNRLIYALAQAAVVVASSAEKGGTRSGALENLDAGWVPLHVRDDGSPGNERLIAQGGTPLSLVKPVEQLDVELLTARSRPSLLDHRAASDESCTLGESSGENDRTASLEPADRPHSETGEEPSDRSASIDDAFVVVWPILAKHLREPVRERDVAERTKLELSQVRAWLKRAVAEGQVEVTARPKRYVLAATAAKQLRIDGA
jgi:DNA processing protein